ncbi:MAG: DUF1648 domain-containing protein [Candidatus Altiarchaeales archaeon]|nr:DUF1648 domain-containing protein [Candidatus Altiarchaeales archaeon]MBD3417065.1 DUF1648 domain-containing protein [Candidatus Altiarchaeales archaeon]
MSLKPYLIPTYIVDRIKYPPLHYPMMEFRTSLAVSAALVVLSLASSGFLYGQLPHTMASHWNASGEVDGRMGRGVAAFMLPAILAVLLVFFAVIPRIDPLKRNIEEFKGYYGGFIVVFTLFMMFVHFHMLLWNVGVRLSTNVVVPAGVGLLFIYIGYLLPHTRRNWFIGVRTPWTLSDDRVWEKTHRVGGKLFTASGLVALAGALVSDQAVAFIIVPVLASAAYLILYSYLEYRKLGK